MTHAARQIPDRASAELVVQINYRTFKRCMKTVIHPFCPLRVVCQRVQRVSLHSLYYNITNSRVRIDPVLFLLFFLNSGPRVIYVIIIIPTTAPLFLNNNRHQLRHCRLLLPLYYSRLAQTFCRVVPSRK